jgi:RHS repeat-associated protein
MGRRPRSSSDRRRRNAVKVNLEQLETRWLLHQGGGPLGTIVHMERLSERGIHTFDAAIQHWASVHQEALQRLWTTHPHWSEAVGLPMPMPMAVTPASNKVSTTTPPRSAGPVAHTADDPQPEGGGAGPDNTAPADTFHFYTLCNCPGTANGSMPPSNGGSIPGHITDGLNGPSGGSTATSSNGGSIPGHITDGGPMESDANMVTGEFLLDHQDVTYQSLGLAQGIDLQYSSLQANPLPVVTAALTTGIGSDSSHLTAITVELTLDSVSQGSAVTYTGISLSDGSTYLAAYQGDATGLASGVYPATLTITKYFDNASPQVENYNSDVPVANRATSPYGAGWSIGGLQQIFGATSSDAVITAGSSEPEHFTSTNGTDYAGNAEDTSTLTHNGDGTWTRAYPDGTVVTFNSSGKETSTADRNGNTYSFAYVSGTAAAGALHSITDPVGLITTLVYDSTSGYLQSIKDPNNRFTMFDVDSNDNLTQITDPDGAVTQYGYSTPGNHLITTEVNPNNHTATITYDSFGRFASETLFDGTSTVSSTPAQEAGLAAAGGSTALALPSGYQGRPTDPDGHAPTITYDNHGQATGVVDATGAATSIVRDAHGWPLAVTDSLGRTTSYAYDAKGNVTQVTRPDGTSMSILYDASFSQPTQVTDFNGHVTTYALDSHGNVTRRTDPDGLHEDFTYNAAGQVLTDTDRAGNTVTYAYDSRGRLTTLVYPGAGSPTVKISYTGAGNVSSVTDEMGDTTSYTYDNANRILTSKDAIQAAAGKQVQYRYDDAGNLTSVTDANGHTTSYVYDTRNDLIATVDPVNQGAGKQTSYTYDATGNLTAVIDPLGHEATYSYDDVNRMTGMTDADGNHTTWVYDSEGELTAVIDPDGHATSYVYDQDGRLQDEVDPTQTGGLATYAYSYDNNDNIKTETDPLGHTVSYSYDALDRLTTMVQDAGSGGSNLITTVYGYDPNGNQTAVTDGLGHTTTSTYDERNRVTAVTEPGGGGTTSYTYDKHSRLLSLTDPDDNTTSYAYDSADRITTVTDPLGNATSYSYDYMGNVTGETDRDGRIYQYGYDADDRMTTEKWIPIGGGTAFNTITHTYDAAGRETQVQDSTSKYAYTYDDANRLLTVDDTGTTGLPQVTLTYGYDAAGNRTSLDDSEGGLTSYTYDARAELATITQSGTGVAAKRVDFQYDSAGRMTTLTRYRNLAGTSPSLMSAYDYDGANRVTSIVHETTGGTVRVSYQYTYDAASRVTQEDRSWTSGVSTDTLTYGYTDNDQLTSVTHTNGSLGDESFGYDANGNRDTGSYSTGTDNRLSTDGTYNYTYDDEGNLTVRTKISDGSETLYAYDYHNRLTEVDSKPAAGATVVLATYTYDALDRRIGRTEGGTATGTVYDGDAPILDFNGSGTQTARYMQGVGAAVDMVLAREISGTVGWYLPDRLGTIRDIANNSGAIVDHVNYGAFGGQLSESSPANGDRLTGFAGMERDTATGLNLAVYRVQDPATGGWLNEDSLGFAAGDANLYRYAGNGPTGASDPSGLIDWGDLSIRMMGGLQAIGGLSETLLGGALVIAPEPTTLTKVGGALLAAHGIDNYHTGMQALINGRPSQTVTTGLVSGGLQSVGVPKEYADPLGEGVNSGVGMVGPLRAGRLLEPCPVSIPQNPTWPASTPHGNSLNSPRTAYLYRLEDSEGNLLKWGVTQDMSKRYPKSFLKDKVMRLWTSGTRADMIRLERELVETQPGTLNHEPWAGSRLEGGQP